MYIYVSSLVFKFGEEHGNSCSSHGIIVAQNEYLYVYICLITCIVSLEKNMEIL
jgi:hypothetical protein